MKVLIIDDSQLKAEHIKQCFNNLNITDVDIETTRNTGLMAVEANIKADTPYDLIVCDMQMPNMINSQISSVAGYTTIRTLRIRGIKTPVIMCSSEHTLDFSEHPNVIGMIKYEYNVDHTNDIESLLTKIQEVQKL